MKWTSWALAWLLGLGACAPLRPPLAVSELPRSEPAVRVGVAVDTAEVRVSAPGGFEIRQLGSGRLIRSFAEGDTVIVRADATGDLLLDAGGVTLPIGTTVTIHPRRLALLNLGGRDYRGTGLIRAAGPGRLTAINQVEMEEYLLGVVPYEIGRVGPELLEAAKAQAVAARTYAMRYLGRRAELGFDVFATVQDQVYGGWAGEHEPVSRAVRETAGEILTFGNEPIEAFYHSTCSGQTAAIEEVWPTEAPRPYLVSVLDTNAATGEAFDVTSSRYRWTQRWTAEELHGIFTRTLADSLPPGVDEIGELREIEVLERTRSGRIANLRITTSTATFLVGRDRIRWIFLTPAGNILNSSNFEVEIERDEQGRVRAVVADGMGWGHGIGMCQVGAMGRARAGQEYRTILQTYYPGTSVVRLY